MVGAERKCVAALCVLFALLFSCFFQAFARCSLPQSAMEKFLHLHVKDDSCPRQSATWSTHETILCIGLFPEKAGSLCAEMDKTKSKDEFWPFAAVDWRLFDRLWRGPVLSQNSIKNLQQLIQNTKQVQQEGLDPIESVFGFLFFACHNARSIV